MIIVEIGADLYFNVKGLPADHILEIRDYDVNGIDEEHLLTDGEGRQYVQRWPQ